MYQLSFLDNRDVTSSVVSRYLEKSVVNESNKRLEISTTDYASRRLNTKPAQNKDPINKPKQNEKDGKGKANKEKNSCSIPTFPSVDLTIPNTAILGVLT